MHEIKISGINLERTFDCGQAFRWRPLDGGFTGVAEGRPLFLRQEGDVAQFDCPEGDLSFWKNYFALDCDYAAIWELFERDEKLRLCRECAYGIRVLRQPPFETLITFIISANNHVPRIRSIVERLSARFGEPVGENMYAFPSPEALARADESDV